MLLLSFTVGWAQSLRKMEAKALNRTHLTLVHGDTVEICSVTTKKPSAKSLRRYFWVSQDDIHQAVGAYQGRLLHGPYQLLDREQHLLVSGEFAYGLKTGEWRTWQPDGSLASTQHWSHGRPKRKATAYDGQGKPVRAAKRASSKDGTAASKSKRKWAWNPFTRKQAAATPTPAAAPATPKQKKPRKPKRQEAPASSASAPKSS